MATTAPGSPYVESSDLVANYPAVSEALAERVDTVGVLPFATSTARGTALPSPTEGQYTYLQDTNATEYWDGSAWVAAGVAPGLVHIITTTFSAVSSVSLDNVFSSTYENYQVKLDFTGSVDATTDLRYRVGGVDNSDANSYKGQALRGSSTSATAFSNSGNIGTSAVSDGGTLRSVCTVEVFDPALAVTTFWMNTNRTRDDMIGIFTFRHTTATAFDGFTIIPASGTITGTIRVYGYANGA